MTVGGLDMAGLQTRWVDAAMLLVLAVSTLTGLLRGLLFEVLSLLGWAVAYFTAQWAAPMLGQHLPLGATGSALNYAAAFMLCFIATLIAWGLLSRLLRLLLRATPLSPLDRVFGAGFGLLRGLVVLLVVATVVALTPLEKTRAWRQSIGAVWLNVALQGLKPVLPNELSRHLPA